MNILKLLFGISHEEPTIVESLATETKSEPIFRVRPNYECSEYWRIDYSRDGKQWNSLPEKYGWTVNRDHMHHRIFSNKDAAIRLAKSLKEEGKLDEFIAEAEADLKRVQNKWDDKQACLRSRKETII